jgi:hypothetical protein
LSFALCKSWFPKLGEKPLSDTPEDRRALALVVSRAIWLRLALAVVLHIFTTDYTFAPDQEAYHQRGDYVAKYWTGEVFVAPFVPFPQLYVYYLAVLYWIFGSYALVPKLLNGVVGALTVRVVYELALKVSGSAATALRSARYAAYFPSLVLWSVMNIRDCWVVLFILLVCREAMALQEKFALFSLARLLMAIVLLTQLRDYLLFMIATPMLVSFLVRNRAHMVRNVLIGMIAAVTVIYADASAGADRKLRTPDLEKLNEMRRWSSSAAASATGFSPEADISTPAKALAFLPVGMTYFFLAPFPWTVANFRQAFTIPEMLFFYSLIPPMIRGVMALLRRRLSSALMIVLIGTGVTFGYAIGQGNVGTIYRHRAQVLPFYLIFAAAGIELRRRERSPAVDSVAGGLSPVQARPA